MIGAAGKAFRRALARWVDGVCRAALAVVVTAAAVSGAGLYYSANNLGVFTDTADLLSKELPFRQRYLDYKAAFPQFVDNIAIVVDGENADLVEDVTTELAARMRERPRLFPLVYDPAGDPYFVRNGLLYLEENELEDLSGRLADAEPLLATLAEDMSLRGLFEVMGLAIDDIIDGSTDPAALTDIFGGMDDAVGAQLAGRAFVLSWRKMMMGGILDADDLRRFVLVQPRLDYTTLHPARAAMEAIRDIAARLDTVATGQVRVRLTGGAALDEEELESVAAGASLAGILALLFVGILLVVGLRSARLVVATLVTLIVGLIWTATFAAFAVGHLNLISVTFAVLFIGLGVDFGIQFSLRYQEEVRRGRDTAEALRAAADGVGGALTLAAAAAAIGFFSFVPTAYVGLSELGVISGVGMLIALFSNFTVLPALLTLMPLSPAEPAGQKSGQARDIDSRPGTFASNLISRPGAFASRFILRHAGPIAGAALVLGLAAAVFAMQIRFDFNPLNLSDPTTESVETFRDLMASGSSAAYTIAVLRPDLDQAVALAGDLEGLSEVDEAVTLADFVPKDQEEKLDIIDEINVFLFPVFENKGSKPPPDGAERLAAIRDFRDKIDALLASPRAGALAGVAGRLADRLDRFVPKAAGAGPAIRDRALEDLETSLLATLPIRLERLRLSLGAEPVTLEDLPASVWARNIASDGRAMVRVIPAEDLGENEALRRFVRAVQAVAPDATDSPVLMIEAGDAVTTAFKKAGVIAFVAITLLLLVVLRSPADTGMVLLPLALAAVLTIAATVLFNIPFNFANVIALPLLLSLGVAFGIHLVLRQRAVASVAEVLETSTPRAILFSALTTMSSFGTLVISNHRGTASMGQLLTIALSFALACTLVVLPAMLELRARYRTASRRGSDS